MSVSTTESPRHEERALTTNWVLAGELVFEGELMFDDLVKELNTVWYHPRSFWESLGVPRSLGECNWRRVLLVEETSFRSALSRFSSAEASGW